MITHINHDLTGLAFETHRARMGLDDSVAKLSSGKRMQNARHDAGGFQQAAKLGSRHKRDVASMQNLQNLVSYSQIQNGSLETVGKILNRMNTLATRALDVTSTDSDRENYNKEFIELTAQLKEIKLEKFNDTDVFGWGGFSDEKKAFIDALKNGWLKSAEDLVSAQYGWNIKPSDSWNLIVNEKDTGGYAAFVSVSTDGTGTSDVLEMQFDLPDFTAPHTQPTSQSDRTVAHEMVHLMQAQNSYFGDLTGDGSSSANWFKEGLAEFINGGDERVTEHLYGTWGQADPAAPMPSDAQIDTLLGAIGTGNEGWSASDQYASAYLATRYLQNEIQAGGIAWRPDGLGFGQEGIKHLTEWMKTGFDAGKGAVDSGLDAYFQKFTGFADTNAFIASFKGASGRNFVKTIIIPNLSNADTGSIGGSDAGLKASADGQAVVPDNPGTAGGSPVFEIEPGNLAATIDGSGKTWNLKTVDTITNDDTATYNLESITNARSTLTQLTAWMTNLSTERSLVGANLSRLEKEMDNLSRKMGGREMAVSRIEDTDVARESTKFASNQVRMQASVAILAQAKQTSVMLADLVRGVNVGG